MHRMRLRKADELVHLSPQLINAQEHKTQTDKPITYNRKDVVMPYILAVFWGRAPTEHHRDFIFRGEYPRWGEESVKSGIKTETGTA